MIPGEWRVFQKLRLAIGYTLAGAVARFYIPFWSTENDHVGKQQV